MRHLTVSHGQQGSAPKDLTCGVGVASGDERQPSDDLARFMDAYTEAWNAGDLDGIVGAYATRLRGPSPSSTRSGWDATPRW